MAENVTITTFLELKDNMSDGLKKVEASLKRLAESQKGGAASASKVEDARLKAIQRNSAKATEFAARQAQKQKALAERLALAELKATQKAHAAAARASDSAARRKTLAELKGIRQVEAARNRAHRLELQRARAEERAHKQARKETKDLIAKAGAAMFGPSVGGIMAAGVSSVAAAGALAAGLGPGPAAAAAAGGHPQPQPAGVGADSCAQRGGHPAPSACGSRPSEPAAR